MIVTIAYSQFTVPVLVGNVMISEDISENLGNLVPV